MSQPIDSTHKLSLYEEELYGTQEAEEPTRQLIIFSLGEEHYGVDVLNVQGVLPSLKITFLPNAPVHILGIINLRGNITSITNLKKVFGLPPETENGKNQIVVIESKGISTGLWVDGHAESIEMPISRIQSLVSTLDEEKNNFIEGQFDWNGRLIGVLNAEKIVEKTKLSLGGDEKDLGA